jgi:hypothetical protein
VIERAICKHNRIFKQAVWIYGVKQSSHVSFSYKF